MIEGEHAIVSHIAGDRTRRGAVADLQGAGGDRCRSRIGIRASEHDGVGADNGQGNARAGDHTGKRQDLAGGIEHRGAGHHDVVHQTGNIGESLKGRAVRHGEGAGSQGIVVAHGDRATLKLGPARIAACGCERQGARPRLCNLATRTRDRATEGGAGRLVDDELLAAQHNGARAGQAPEGLLRAGDPGDIKCAARHVEGICGSKAATAHKRQLASGQDGAARVGVCAGEREGSGTRQDQPAAARNHAGEGPVGALGDAQSVVAQRDRGSARARQGTDGCGAGDVARKVKRAGIQGHRAAGGKCAILGHRQRAAVDRGAARIAVVAGQGQGAGAILDQPARAVDGARQRGRGIAVWIECRHAVQGDGIGEGGVIGCRLQHRATCQGERAGTERMAVGEGERSGIERDAAAEAGVVAGHGQRAGAGLRQDAGA